jgi:sialate O-acetylesterase
MKKRFLLMVGVMLTASLAQAELKLPAIIGDHMVLEQGSASVWGWAAAGKTITVSIAGQEASGVAGPDGKWKATFDALAAGGPNDLVVSGDGSVTFADVLVGDVWIGSGQSNMELALKQEKSADSEIPKADLPQIRLFTVEHASSTTPQGDVKGTWKVCSPTTAPDFSAVAYYFGKGIQQTLKQPVGLIMDCWGGSPAEDWVPRPALDKEPDFTALLADWDKDRDRTAAWTDGLPYEFMISDLRFTPKDGKGQAATLALQTGDKGLGGMWNCYINPGSTGTFTPQGRGPKGDLAASLAGLMMGGDWITLQTSLKSGNTPTDLSGYASIDFYAKGKGKYRLKLGQASIGDYDYYSTDAFEAPADWQPMSFPISSLKQGGWGSPKPFAPDSILSFIITPEVPYNPEVASVAYNGMIAPLIPFKIKGVLWYQGEANWARTSQYQKMLSTLITSWREAWGETFPFLIVQLPNFGAVQTQPSESAWAEMREAQLQTSQSVTDTGVVTTIDLGDPNNIHPKDKKDVGDRLTRLALAMVYGKAPSYFSPVFVKAAVTVSAMTVRFKNVGGGLAAKADGTVGSGPVTGFALAGPDERFYWADAKITGKSTVEVTCPQVTEPMEVRYAWADSPFCNLASVEGFPASPFRFSFPPKPGAKKPDDDIPPPP